MIIRVYPVRSSPSPLSAAAYLLACDLVPPPAATAGDIARNYLRTGVMPKPRSDTAVSIFGPGGMGRSVAGAYDVPTGAVAGDVSSVEDI